MITPRYLVPFDSRRANHRFTDVLVIGGGLAGLRAAHAIEPNLSVLVVTKDVLRESNSNYAQGGIAGVLDPDDCFDDHVRDTLIAGKNLCERDVVERVIREAPLRIEELIRWGTQFDKHAGELALGREGGHSHERIVHALGDATGREIMRAMIEHTREAPNIDTWENTFTVDLLTLEGRCRGAVIVRDGEQPTMVWAKETILCTGGVGQVFRESTNPAVATGDGTSLAYRAGVELRDMEFIQFHPTVLYIAGSSRSLITEAVRGEGAHLVNASGERFMPNYDDRAELAPRDIVSQSIVSEMNESSQPCVYLSLAHLNPEHVRSRFPGIAEACQQFGLDITTDRIPVRPGAHYMIGGVSVDSQGRTSLPGLWAAGEATSSGLHGANRLASNSLLEGLVYGAHAGESASRSAAEGPHKMVAYRIQQTAREQTRAFDIADVRVSLKSLMGRLVGVQRDAAGLAQAHEQIRSLSTYVMPHQFDSVEGWELQNLLLTASAMTAAALARQESRGVHFRSDFPETDNENWRCHQTQQIDVDGGYPQRGELITRPTADHVAPSQRNG
ncbi:L-aspartate oxidase [Allorhodopirellula solitaria]|uniref:L-aspartate oxidase n=1 Tax=Allorhodopirellula solitaria TaxID=2527987 RepID=A0A5C5YC11_9BACT|nr:L-aspartate oxidase [Allorhodopirellula solitaria]TWT73257.1 L-aspartate oxidase [Allorhodopirellula solitaria]